MDVKDYQLSCLIFDNLELEVKKAAKSHKLAVLKIVITAGSGGRGYSRKGITKPTVIVTISDYPEHYLTLAEQGIALVTSSIQLAKSPLLAGLKHLNRLEQVLIRQELDNKSALDGVVLDIDDKVVETSCANIFWLNYGVIYTPSLKYSGVNGIYRDLILAYYPDTKIVSTSLEELLKAQTVFICNCLMGIVPVKSIGNTEFSIEQIKPIQAKIKEALSGE